ncbi:MAG TPA: glycosyltransferase [Thermoleophilaceae bacterium]|nr:glycosyltransferase [Thermoleophilaceae bacterium]
MSAPRFILYSHDGCGLGHLRRNLAIAAALTGEAPGASVVLLTGCIELGAQGLARNVEIVSLPSLKKLGNGRYGARRLPISPTMLGAVRAGLITAAVESFRPDVLLIDKHPMGVRGELRPALQSLPEWGGRAVLGLRDILDDPATVREEWSDDGVVEFTEAHCEALLIYGNPHVFDFVGEYGLPASLARRARHCGYVVNPNAAPRPALASAFARRPRVLATAGGGEDGRRLLETFAQAARVAEWDAVMVAGPQSSPADQGALQRMAADAGVAFHASVSNLPELLPHVDALVSMGGYNTLSEALSLGTPTLCVPRAHPRREQLIRARSFANLNLLRLVEPERLRPELLRAEVTTLLGTDRRELARRAHAALGFGGAQAAGKALLELAADAPPAGTPIWPAARTPALTAL